MREREREVQDCSKHAPPCHWANRLGSGVRKIQVVDTKLLGAAPNSGSSKETDEALVQRTAQSPLETVEGENWKQKSFHRPWKKGSGLALRWQPFKEKSTDHSLILKPASSQSELGFKGPVIQSKQRATGDLKMAMIGKCRMIHGSQGDIVHGQKMVPTFFIMLSALHQ